MGQAAVAIPIAASVASTGLTAVGDVAAGKAKQNEANFQASQYDMRAQQAERAADFGRLQAQLTDVTMREQLNTTLGNIDTIRAAAHVDPTSPSTQTVKDFESVKSDRQRTAALVTINSQVAEDTSSANYLEQAKYFAVAQGETAANMGWIKAGSDVFSGIAKVFSGGLLGGQSAPSPSSNVPAPAGDASYDS